MTTKTKFIFIVMFFNLFIISFDSHSAEYYVSTAGNDNNPGTSPSFPWQTLEKVSQTNFNPGDVIKFKGGDIFSPSFSTSNSKLWIYNKFGTEESPIIYTSYGGTRATIIADTIGIYVVNSEYVEIRSLNIRGNFNPFNQGGATFYGQVIFSL